MSDVALYRGLNHLVRHSLKGYILHKRSSVSHSLLRRQFRRIATRAHTHKPKDVAARAFRGSSKSAASLIEGSPNMRVKNKAPKISEDVANHQTKRLCIRTERA